jgi:hypothetical protein
VAESCRTEGWAAFRLGRGMLRPVAVDRFRVVRRLRVAYETAADAAAQRRFAYHDAVIDLYRSGVPLRDIANALGVSHQRVHQIVSGGPARRARNLAEDRATGSAHQDWTGNLRSIHQSAARRVAKGLPVVCDVCGGVPAETVSIRLPGRNLQKDLCASHVADLLKGARVPKRGSRRGSAGGETQSPAARKRGRQPKVPLA